MAFRVIRPSVRDVKATLAFYGGEDIAPRKERVKRLDPNMPTEDEEQIKYFVWVGHARINGESLEPHIYHVPNGGARDPRTGARLKRLGVRKGVPDISVDIPSAPYHGLRIEMKRLDGEASASQLAQIKFRNAMGYLAIVCQGFEAARRETTAYLKRSFNFVDPYGE